MPGSTAGDDFDEDVRSTLQSIKSKSNHTLYFLSNRTSSSTLTVSKLTVTSSYFQYYLWYLRSEIGIGVADITKLKANGFYTVTVSPSSPSYYF
jgi:hypothetical protein